MARLSVASPWFQAALQTLASYPILSALSAVVLSLVYKVWISPVLYPSPYRRLPAPQRQSWLAGNRMVESAPFTYTSTDGHQVRLHGPALRLHYYAKELGTHVYNLPGPFGSESIFLADPHALAHVLGDTDTWQSPALRSALIENLTANGIVLQYGHVHRKQRKLIGPSFSTQHMSAMVGTFAELGDRMCTNIGHRVDRQRAANQEAAEIDCLYWLDCVMLDIVGLTGFGYNFKALETGRDGSDLGAAFNSVNQAAMQYSLMSVLISLGAALWAPIGNWPLDKTNRALKQSNRVIARISKQIVQEKKQEILKEADAVEVLSDKKDLLSLMIKANLVSTAQEQMTDHEIACQIQTFTFAGYETSSVTLSFVLFYLSTNLDVQRKLRTLLDKTFRDRKGVELKDLTAQDIRYEDLWCDELEYLDHVLQETLRLCPPVIYSQRQAVKDDVIPLLHPIKSRDGKETIHSIAVKKGTVVDCAFKAANYREDLFGSDPEHFHPERWTNLPELHGRARIPPFGLFSFSGGPKSCIGSKFSLSEMKTVLILFLRHFQVLPVEGIKIQPEIALVVRPRAQAQDGSSLSGMPLRVERLY